MMSHTCLIPPTGVPVDVMTHCTSLGEPPRATCNVDPTGHDVEAAEDGVVPTKDVATAMPVTVDSTRANDMRSVRRRYLDVWMSFIRRNVARSGYLKPSTRTRKCNSCVTSRHWRDRLARAKSVSDVGATVAEQSVRLATGSIR